MDKNFAFIIRPVINSSAVSVSVRHPASNFCVMIAAYRDIPNLSPKIDVDSVEISWNSASSLTTEHAEAASDCLIEAARIVREDMIAYCKKSDEIFANK